MIIKQTYSPHSKLTIYAAINKHFFMAENNPAQLKT